MTQTEERRAATDDNAPETADRAPQRPGHSLRSGGPIMHRDRPLRDDLVDDSDVDPQ